MKAQDIMTSPVITVGLDTPVQDIAQLLLQSGISAVPVVDDKGLLAGIVSEGDLMHRPELGTERQGNWWLDLFGDRARWSEQYARSHGQRARDVMTEGVISVDEQTPVSQIASLLEKHRIKRVPVLRDQKLIGIVSRANLVRAFAAIEAHVPEPHEDERALRREILRNIEQSGASTSLLNVIVEAGRVQVWGSVESEAERKAVRVAVEQAVKPEKVDYHLGIMTRAVRAVMWGE
jgi:CBS domain-containing protein